MGLTETVLPSQILQKGSPLRATRSSSDGITQRDPTDKRSRSIGFARQGNLCSRAPAKPDPPALRPPPEIRDFQHLFLTFTTSTCEAAPCGPILVVQAI